MKTLIAAVIASAFSLGAVAQTTPATPAPAPMAKTDAAAKPTDAGASKMAHKTAKKGAMKKSKKKMSAPAA